MGEFHRPESGKDKMIVVATEEEYKLAKERFKHQKIVQTGVGPLNVIETLRKYPKWTKIINFGYAGSKTIPIGTEVKIGYSASYHPKVYYLDMAYILDNEESDVWCYTQADFIEPEEAEENAVYDMELAYICALGFKDVKSIKIISDNCNQEEYNKFIKEGK